MFNLMVNDCVYFIRLCSSKGAKKHIFYYLLILLILVIVMIIMIHLSWNVFPVSWNTTTTDKSFTTLGLLQSGNQCTNFKWIHILLICTLNAGLGQLWGYKLFVSTWNIIFVCSIYLVNIWLKVSILYIWFHFKLWL